MELNPGELNDCLPLTKDRDYYDYAYSVNSMLNWAVQISTVRKRIQLGGKH